VLLLLLLLLLLLQLVDCVWNVMAHAQKQYFVFRRNGRVYLNRQGRQFIRLLAADVCASAVVMLYKPRSELVWRVLDTHSIRQVSLHFPSRSSPCAITFQLDSTARGVHSVYLTCLDRVQNNSPLQEKKKKLISLYVRKQLAKYSSHVNPTSFLKIHASQYILVHKP
jgi:hypothetical protein